jgi:uncharacterized protein YbjT (DUF2867 family)
MKYLITGATGNIGSRVVERLLTSGVRPRILVRDPKKAQTRFDDRVEIAVGDLADAASLAAALQGVTHLFLVHSGADLAQRDALAAAAARSAGVKRLVKLSTMDVQQQNIGTGVWHARGEAAVRESGVGFTFVQPSGFMDNALAWAPVIKAGRGICSATGEGRIAFIHPQDIADVSVAALTAAEYEGRSLPITGPEALSYAQMVVMIGEVVGRRIGFQQISDEEERGRWLARGESAESADYHLSIFRAIREGKLAGVTDNVLRVLGRGPIGFEKWARENASAFG